MGIRLGCGAALALLVLSVTVETQGPADAHIASARAASSTDFGELLGSTCDLVKPPTGTPARATSTANPAVRSTWHVEPAKVFDNLYFVGQSEYSAWAIMTSAGIILMDAIYDYSVEDEVVNGLKTLGPDPAQIKYVVISHAHADHAGGAGLLQKRGARIVMSAADWDLLDATKVDYAKPTRDVVATGQLAPGAGGIHHARAAAALLVHAVRRIGEAVSRRGGARQRGCLRVEPQQL